MEHPSEPGKPLPRRFQEYEDPHYHDDLDVEPDDTAARERGRPAPRRQPPRRRPPPRRRYPDD
ncbi:MAG: hypothetical protein NZ700_09300 [Gemmataceae bacterium]|nr:hypothetical protein [Gemmataceae bacterium]MDW8266808.1 hypothetical protein [Gemmataceae bacterium]